MQALYRYYREVWAADCEFTQPPGDRPTPLCLVAREVRSSRLHRLWLTETAPDRPPFLTTAATLVVAYYASAELGCFLALNWPFPQRVLDLYAEFRWMTSGRPEKAPHGYSLLGALSAFGLDTMTAGDKDSMRQLAIR